MRVRANETEGVFLIDSRVGNLLGYVGLSLPSEYEKRIPHEAFKGRGTVGGGVSVFLADTPCPRERAAGSWGLR